MKLLEKLKNRYVQFAIICTIGFSILAFQLSYLTVEKGEELYAESLNRQRVELKLRGNRGNILDRYGIPVAVNNQIYAVQLNRRQFPTDHGEINNVLLKFLDIIYKNGDEDTLIDSIPIKIREGAHSLKDKGKFYYIWEDEEPDVRKERYNKWANRIGVKREMTADEMMEYLRERYKIDESISDEMARRIACIRLEIYMRRFTQYEPIPIASEISYETLIELETFASELPGIQTTVESGRYYPMGETMAHIVGYIGSIQEEQVEQYKEQGYDISRDKIGQVGIEAYGEKWLTGSTKDRQGKLVAEVDSNGKVIRVLEEVAPQNGDNIVLTIDSQLQNAVFSILEEEIAKMRQGLGPYKNNVAPLAEEGAAVVLDVNTGEILAMVSYPSFDPNSPKKEGNQFALAFQGGMIPGSVFKMLIGVAGLMEGEITVNERIYDHGRYTKYDSVNGPRCWRAGGHGYENLSDALKHSCNYFFYEVADRLGVDAINKWATLYGLDGQTGLEILSPEADKNVIPGRETKVEAERGNMRTLIIRIMRRYGYFGDTLTDEQKELVDRLIDFPLSEDRSAKSGLEEIEAIADMLREMGYTENASQAAAEIRTNVLRSYKRWTPSDTIMTGIGQRYTIVSPLSVARYIAALVNGGKVLRTQVVKEIVDSDGKIIEKRAPEIIRQLEINQEYTDAIKEGMWRVVNDASYDGGGAGTAVSIFRDMDPQITLGGKTGTAEVIPTDENRNYAWFVAFTPYEDPEIAVVVAIPNGRTSGNAAWIARRIIEEYYRQKEQRRNELIQPINELQ